MDEITLALVCKGQVSQGHVRSESEQRFISPQKPVFTRPVALLHVCQNWELCFPDNYGAACFCFVEGKAALFIQGSLMLVAKPKVGLVLLKLNCSGLGHKEPNNNENNLSFPNRKFCLISCWEPLIFGGKRKLEEAFYIDTGKRISNWTGFFFSLVDLFWYV